MPGGVSDSNEREHDRDLDQDADNRRERRSRLKPEQTNRNGHSQLEEVTGSDHRRRGRDVVTDSPCFRPPVGDGEYEEGLDDQRHGDQQDMQGIVDYDVPLEGEKQYKRQQ